MTDLPENEQRSVPSVRVQAGVGFADVFLELEYHRTGAVDDRDVVAPGQIVS